MNKKLLIALSTIATITPIAAVISCGTETKAKEVHYTKQILPVNYKYVLNGSLVSDKPVDKDITTMYEDQATNIKVTKDLDDMVVPATIKLNNLKESLFDQVQFVYKDSRVLVNKDNAALKLTISDNSIKFKDGNLVAGTKATKMIDATIEFTNVDGTKITKQFKFVFDAPMTQQSMGDITKLRGDAKVSLPSVWGTTTTLPSLEAPDKSKALEVNMIDVQEAAGGLKSYGYITHIEQTQYQVKLSPTAKYLAMRVYISKELLNTPIWFRSGWPTLHQALDFNSGEGTFTKEGWYLIQAKIDKTLEWTSKSPLLGYLKFCQLASHTAAKSGSVFISDIYQSETEMTAKTTNTLKVI